MQNVKYDSLTGKVYEELGCSTKTPKADVTQTTKNDASKNVTKDVEETTNDQESETTPAMTLNRSNDYNQQYYQDYYGQSQVDHSFIGSNCFSANSYQTGSHQFNPYDRLVMQLYLSKLNYKGY